jgi:hypothetical protein
MSSSVKPACSRRLFHTWRWTVVRPIESAYNPLCPVFSLTSIHQAIAFGSNRSRRDLTPTRGHRSTHSRILRPERRKSGCFPWRNRSWDETGRRRSRALSTDGFVLHKALFDGVEVAYPRRYRNQYLRPGGCAGRVDRARTSGVARRGSFVENCHGADRAGGAAFDLQRKAAEAKAPSADQLLEIN